MGADDGMISATPSSLCTQSNKHSRSVYIFVERRVATNGRKTASPPLAASIAAGARRRLAATSRALAPTRRGRGERWPGRRLAVDELLADAGRRHVARRADARRQDARQRDIDERRGAARELGDRGLPQAQGRREVSDADRRAKRRTLVRGTYTGSVNENSGRDTTARPSRRTWMDICGAMAGPPAGAPHKNRDTSGRPSMLGDMPGRQRRYG